MLSLRKLAPSLTENEKGLFHSGLEEFDRLRIQLSPGQLIVVGARPGVGKTPFLLFMFHKMWESNGIPQLFISTEEPEKLLYKKLAAIVSGTPIQKLQENAGNILSNHLDNLVTEHCFFTQETTGWDKLKEKIKQAATEEIRIIFLEKLQSLHSGNQYPNRDQELGSIMQELKALAMEHQLLIIASSSLGRSMDYRIARTPHLSDLRESGKIEEIADTILLISRPEMYGILEDEFGHSLKNYMEVKVAKNRNGLTGTMNFTFRRDIPSVTEFTGFENQEFTDRFNRLEGGSDTPF